MGDKRAGGGSTLKGIPKIKQQSSMISGLSRHLPSDVYTTKAAPPSSIRKTISFKSFKEEILKNNESNYLLEFTSNSTSIKIKALCHNESFYMVSAIRENNGKTYYCCYQVVNIFGDDDMIKYSNLDSTKNILLIKNNIVEYDETKYLLVDFVKDNRNRLNNNDINKNSSIFAVLKLFNNSVPNSTGSINVSRLNNELNVLLQPNNNNTLLQDYQSLFDEKIEILRNLEVKKDELSQRGRAIPLSKRSSNSKQNYNNIRNELKELLKSIKELNKEIEPIYNKIKDIEIGELIALSNRVKTYPINDEIINLTTLNESSLTINQKQLLQKFNEKKKYIDSKYGELPINEHNIPENNSSNGFMFVSIFDCTPINIDNFKKGNNVVYITKKGELKKGKISKISISTRINGSTQIKSYTVNSKLLTNSNLLKPINKHSNINKQVKVGRNRTIKDIKKVYSKNGNLYYELSNNNKIYSKSEFGNNNFIKKNSSRKKISNYIDNNIKRNLKVGNKINGNEIKSIKRKSLLNSSKVYKLNSGLQKNNKSKINRSYRQITKTEPLIVKYKGKKYRITGVYDTDTVRITSNNNDKKNINVSINDITPDTSNIKKNIKQNTQSLARRVGKFFGTGISSIPTGIFSVGARTAGSAFSGIGEAGGGFARGLKKGSRL